jgi:SAM-dependent methyltransferase
VALARHSPVRPEAPRAAPGAALSKYDPQAEGWTETAYADADAYLRRRAELVIRLGPELRPGDTVFDLACGDGGLGEQLVAHGIAYHGVDASLPMVEAARRRLGERARIEHGDIDEAAPPGPVAATTVFRAIYYARDRRAFFAHARDYTTTKLVFDLNPRQYRIDDVLEDLRAGGFTSVALRPFFVPQTVQLPRPVLAVATSLERSGPLARLALRARFTYLVAASR